MLLRSQATSGWLAPSACSRTASARLRSLLRLFVLALDVDQIFKGAKRA